MDYEDGKRKLLGYKKTNVEKPSVININIFGKISEIKKEIEVTRNELQEAKNKYLSKKNEYNMTSKIRFFKRHKLKEEYENAMYELTIANSEALAKNFKIIGWTLELVLLCFFIPMELIKRTAQWCADGFEKRDKICDGMMDFMIILKGLLRIFICAMIIVVIVFSVFIILKISSNKKINAKLEQQTVVEETVDVSENIQNETIQSLQERIMELEATLNNSNQLDIKQQPQENDVSDEEIIGNYE